LSTLDDLTAEINAQLPTNTTGQITAARLRGVLIDMSSEILADVSLGGTFGGTGDPSLTRAQAIATTFSSPPNTIRTTGYAAVGDNGGHLHKKIGSLPASPLTNVGTFTTADGTNYLMVPDGTEVHVNAFGASPRAGDSDFAVDSLTAFNNCRDWILAYATPAGTAGTTGITMVLDGYYYLSKAFYTGGGNFSIKGQSQDSRITTPWPYDQIIVQGATSGSNTFGREGFTYTSSFPIFLGQRVNVGNHVYVAVVAGTPSGTSPPSGTGTGQVDGTVVWNYERELTYAETQPRFFEGTIENLTVASNWSAFTPHSNNTEATKPSDDQTNLATEGAYFCGILSRTRCTIRNVKYFGQPGMGIAFAGGGDPFLRGPGNVDDWRVEHIGGGFLAWNGFHVGQFNGNAGVALDIDTQWIGAFGIANFAFLDNKFFGTQHDGDGQYNRGFSKYPTSVGHRGYQWMARLPVLGVENTPFYVGEEPGAAPVSLRRPWYRWDGDGTINFATITASISTTTLTVTAKTGTNLNVGTAIYDGGVSAGTKITALGTGTGGTGTYTINNSQTVASTTMHADVSSDPNFAPWSPTQRYMPGGAYGNNNFNNRSVVIGTYMESGTWPIQPGVNDIIEGSLLQGFYDRTKGAAICDAGVWQTSVKMQSMFTSDTGRKTRSVNLGPLPQDGVLSQNSADSALLSFTDYDGEYYEFGSVADFEFSTRGDRTLNNDFDFGKVNDVRKWYRLSGKNTLRKYGNANNLPYMTQIPNLVIGDGGLDGRRVFYIAGGPPGTTTGYARGDIAIEQNATAGAANSWQLTPTGWKVMTTLAA
jgi:hypothetical protein